MGLELGRELGWEWERIGVHSLEAKNMIPAEKGRESLEKVGC